MKNVSAGKILNEDESCVRVSGNVMILAKGCITISASQ